MYNFIRISDDSSELTTLPYYYDVQGKSKLGVSFKTGDLVKFFDRKMFETHAGNMLHATKAMGIMTDIYHKTILGDIVHRFVLYKGKLHPLASLYVVEVVNAIHQT